jgi:5-deoxy-glucuronate isomerase
MSKLISRPQLPDESGCIQKITPQSAGWDHVGFEVFRLKKGQVTELNSSNDEVCLVFISGKGDVSIELQSWTDIGNRMSPFDQVAPFSVYIPPRESIRVEATTDLEFALCRAPAKGELPARLITPEQCHYVVRGAGTNTRHVCNILFNEGDAESLLVVEVITPGGHWSSYPPHKHDSDNEPNQTQLEETYYHRLNPPQGFAFQRVYNDERTLDETMSVENRDVVMVPEGYHPVGAAHGYDLYYLNVMAGPKRKWIFKNDPAHEWMIK